MRFFPLSRLSRFLLRLAFPAGLVGLALVSVQLPGLAEKAPPVTPRVEARYSHPDYDEYMLPAGTAFQVLLQTPIDTAVNQPDDPLDALLSQNIYLGEKILLTKNTHFTGRIAQLDPPMEGRNAILYIVFTEITLDNDDRISITAHIRTERPDHTWGGELTQGTKTRLVTHHVYGIGDYNQTVFTGPRAMGRHISFPPGERWTIILDKPLTVLRPRTSDD